MKPFDNINESYKKCFDLNQFECIRGFLNIMNAVAQSHKQRRLSKDIIYNKG